ncbi:DUF3034 family protein [Alteromonas mediterranea]|uniref:DUF3034 domain-containing protein n=2 Tax=Alteromonas mediterranea TaxID=314275 RepID=S5ABK8_9ALTE|nr:DUF3034 family protein [Alteromonas mediterranea]AEA97005.1 hypothetical protein MADE_1004285 [Alteromonas mediterranea DE]AGP77080.1 hypothetical protein I633_04105 [Alteromonas mediterranea 615]MEA3380370.1 DUF3034 family protein [Pseudomonadota bacterium]CAH1200939.1 hypothetical protein ISS312_00797 [Alteromonas mediterranea]
MIKRLLLSLFFISPLVFAQSGSRLIASGGITGFEGTAGGGITPWAFIGGYTSKEEISYSANVQYLSLNDYSLTTAGASISLFDRVEISVQRQRLDISAGLTSNVFALLTEGAVTNANSATIEQDIVGAKVKLFGDGVFTQNSWGPQVAIGAQYKKNRDFDSSLSLPDGTVPLPEIGVPLLLGAKDDSGTDVYVSATKLWLGTPSGYNLLTNLTARYTKANVFGLLGFGTEENDNAKLEWEGSLALLISPTTAIGTEFRTQTNRLGGLAEEDTVVDAFIAYFPNKSISITAAYVDLGNLPLQESSSGFYLSVNGNF